MSNKKIKKEKTEKNQIETLKYVTNWKVKNNYAISKTEH